MQITIETTVRASREEVWRAWTTPEDIVRWNAASDDWHEEGRASDPVVRVRETFDAEATNPIEMQRRGWQAILDNFARHVEGGVPGAP